MKLFERADKLIELRAKRLEAIDKFENGFKHHIHTIRIIEREYNEIKFFWKKKLKYEVKK